MTEINFNAEKHQYTNQKGDIYISCTQLVSLFVPEFDKEFWLYYKSLQRQLGFDNTEAGKKAYAKFLIVRHGFDFKNKSIDKLREIALLETVEQESEKETLVIEGEWKDINKTALTKGTNFHNAIEEKQLGSEKYEFTGKKEKVLVNSNFHGDISKINQNGIIPELRLYNHRYKIAGTTDQPYFELPYFDINDWKGLALDTPMLTSTGWKTMRELQKGELIYDGEGNWTKILNLSEIHYNPCYKLEFENGEVLIADHEHKWVIGFDDYDTTYTTEELYNLTDTTIRIKCPVIGEINDVYRLIKLTSIVATETVPTRCLEVESETHTYLAGKTLIKTHNTNKAIKFENKHEKLLYCLSHLDACNFVEYNIQLSLYAWMLEQYGYKLRNLGITHILFNNNDEASHSVYYPMKYLKKEVENMLEYYDKHLRKN